MTDNVKYMLAELYSRADYEQAMTTVRPRILVEAYECIKDISVELAAMTEAADAANRVVADTWHMVKEAKAALAARDAEIARLRHALEEVTGLYDDEQGSIELGKRLYDAMVIANAALSQPASAPAAQGEPVSEEWLWMRHPSYNGGDWIPVQVFEDGDVKYYRPFDEHATDFEWDLRDEAWEIMAAAPKEPK